MIGTGGFAKEVGQLIYEINRAKKVWEFGGYLTNDESLVGKSLLYGSIVGMDDLLLESREPTAAVIGVGLPSLRAAMFRKVSSNSLIDFPNLIHPRAVIDLETVTARSGNIVTASTVFTCDIRIGDQNVFNLCATVGHDVSIGSFNVINPSVNISGSVTLEDQILVGTGAQILQNLRISSGSVIGAGAVVTKNVPQNQTWLGVPAKHFVLHT